MFEQLNRSEQEFWFMWRNADMIIPLEESPWNPVTESLKYHQLSQIRFLTLRSLLNLNRIILIHHIYLETFQ